MTKVVQISDDMGTNWYTFPGPSGDASRESAQITDTILGQDWASTEVGLVGWSYTAPAYFRGFAGYRAKISQAGTPTAIALPASGVANVTAVSSRGDQRRYQITAADQQLLDRTVTPAVTVDLPAGQVTSVAITAAGTGHAVGETFVFAGTTENGAGQITAVSGLGAITETVITAEGVGVANNAVATITTAAGAGATLTATATAAASALVDTVEEVDYLFGIITLSGVHTTGETARASYTYQPLVEEARAMSFTLSMTAETIDESNFKDVRPTSNDGHRILRQGLRTVSLDLTGIYTLQAPVATSPTDYPRILAARDEIVVEVNPDGNGLSRARGYFRLNNQAQSGEVGALEEETLTFNLRVPAGDIRPFGWEHRATTTMHQSVRIALDAYEDGEFVDARYLPDGTNGRRGRGFIADASLSSGMEEMNEFSVTVMGTGQETLVP